MHIYIRKLIHYICKQHFFSAFTYFFLQSFGSNIFHRLSFASILLFSDRCVILYKADYQVVCCIELEIYIQL